MCRTDEVTVDFRGAGLCEGQVVLCLLIGWFVCGEGHKQCNSNGLLCKRSPAQTSSPSPSSSCPQPPPKHSQSEGGEGGAGAGMRQKEARGTKSREEVPRVTSCVRLGGLLARSRKSAGRFPEKRQPLQRSASLSQTGRLRDEERKASFEREPNVT